MNKENKKYHLGFEEGFRACQVEHTHNLPAALNKAGLKVREDQMEQILVNLGLKRGKEFKSEG